jgi:murein endopeptidase
VLRLIALVLAALTPSVTSKPAPRPMPVLRPHLPSRAVGLPWAGRLEHGVELSAAGEHFFTWDPVLHRSPNRAWRRWGADRLVRLTLAVVNAYAAAHPAAPRVGIGDLSRPRGGDFGPRFGGIGHVSHQNGLDVDVFYPRLDRRERPPRSAGQIDRALAQDLVDRFVRAGAVRVFVGPHTHLTGPPKVVQVLPLHDNHLHVRIRRPTAGASSSPASSRRRR